MEEFQNNEEFVCLSKLLKIYLAQTIQRSLW